jgi:hypothetical protein
MLIPLQRQRHSTTPGSANFHKGSAAYLTNQHDNQISDDCANLMKPAALHIHRSGPDESALVHLVKSGRLYSWSSHSITALRPLLCTIPGGTNNRGPAVVVGDTGEVAASWVCTVIVSSLVYASGLKSEFCLCAGWGAVHH